MEEDTSVIMPRVRALAQMVSIRTLLHKDAEYIITRREREFDSTTGWGLTKLILTRIAPQGRIKEGRRRNEETTTTKPTGSDSDQYSSTEGDVRPMTENRSEAQTEEMAVMKEFESCNRIAQLVFEQMPADTPPPDQVIVERATPHVYAVRILVGGEIQEAFFVTSHPDAQP